MNIKRLSALAMGLVVGLAGVARAEEAPEMSAQVKALQTRVAELEAKQNGDWLNARRAEEVKSLIREVLADADTRASLMDNAVTAGHNGQSFFLASEDGSFLLNISGQIQFRYMVEFRNDPTAGDEDGGRGGFQTGHTYLNFFGHVGNPRFGYYLRLSLDNEENLAEFARAIVTYQLTDKISLWWGENEAPFLREQLIESSHQLAVERSLVNAIFTMGLVQGAGLKWDASNAIKVQVAVSDGIRSAAAQYNNDNIFDENADDSHENDKWFTNDSTDFAVTARVDVKLAGDWSQWNEFTAWSGQANSIFLGAALHWEVGETGSTNQNDNFFAWTVDASVTMRSLSVYAAVVGLHTDYEFVTNHDFYGFVIQGSYNINDKIEPFLRYEYMDLDDTVAKDHINLVTFGFNYYFQKQRSKFSLDVVWALDQIPQRSTFGISDVTAHDIGLFPDANGKENQIVVRAQFQLLF